MASCDECERLRAINAELLAALKGLAKLVHDTPWSSGWPGRPHTEMDAAHAAVAKAEGTPPPVSGGAPADPMAMPRDKTDHEWWLESEEAWAFFCRERARRDVP